MKPGRLQIRGLYSDLHADFAAKVERRSLLAASQLSEPSGQGLETVELAIRTTMTSCWSGSWDSARAIAAPCCGQGHQADFTGYPESIGTHKAA